MTVFFHLFIHWIRLQQQNENYFSESDVLLSSIFCNRIKNSVSHTDENVFRTHTVARIRPKNCIFRLPIINIYSIKHNYNKHIHSIPFNKPLEQ